MLRFSRLCQRQALGLPGFRLSQIVSRPCSTDVDEDDDAADRVHMTKALEEDQQGINANTRYEESEGGTRRRFWKNDLPFSSQSDTDDLARLSDVDSNLDEGSLMDNKRYLAYNKHFHEEQVKEPLPLDVTQPSKILRKERFHRDRTEFHREKMITQTGRTKDIKEASKVPDFEPGFTPDYLPRLFNVSDASEWVDHTDDPLTSEGELDLEEEERKANPGKWDKIKNFRSPYWATATQIHAESDEDSQRELDVSRSFAADAPDGVDVDAMGGGADTPTKTKKSSSLSESGGSDQVPMDHRSTSESPPDTASSTEDCPTDIYEDIDFMLDKKLIPPEHDVQYRDDFMHQMLIKTGRHCKVTTGGRIFTSSALVLVGNGDGVGGLGYGKGEDFAEALSLALKDAKKKLIAVRRVDNSVSYQAKQKYCRARVYVWPLAKKQGVRGSYKQQVICDLFGLTDIRIKTFGRRNDHNIYKALIRCLQTSETPEMCARRRGKKVWDINKNWRVNNRARGY